VAKDSTSEAAPRGAKIAAAAFAAPLLLLVLGAIVFGIFTG